MAQINVDLIQSGLVFQQSAFAISKRIHDDILILTQDQIQEMTNSSQELFSKSKVMFELSVLAIAETIKPSLDSLSQAKDDITKAIEKIEKVQDVIDLTVKLVSLASAILAGDVTSIPSLTQDILSASQDA